MAGKSVPLRGRSELLQPDGTVVPVRDLDGKPVIDPAEWAQVRQQIGKQVGRVVSQMVSRHPERKAAFGMPDQQRSATVDLIDLLKGNAPAGAQTTGRRRQN